jgi:hypothetical protein
VLPFKADSISFVLATTDPGKKEVAEVAEAAGSDAPVEVKLAGDMLSLHRRGWGQICVMACTFLFRVRDFALLFRTGFFHICFGLEFLHYKPPARIKNKLVIGRGFAIIIDGP